MTERVECVVVGAGVVGLAVGRALAIAGREVLVLDAADAIGTGTSSRNSEVIHAGIYYPAGSLKARLCVDGKRMLYEYCQARGIPHSRLGKLIVASDAAEVPVLASICAKAEANGVDDLQTLSGPPPRRSNPPSASPALCSLPAPASSTATPSCSRCRATSSMPAAASPSTPPSAAATREMDASRSISAAPSP